MDQQPQQPENVQFPMQMPNDKKPGVKKFVIITLAVLVVLIIAVALVINHYVKKVRTFVSTVKNGVTNIEQDKNGNIIVNTQPAPTLTAEALVNKGSWKCTNYLLNPEQKIITAEDDNTVASDRQGGIYYANNFQDIHTVAHISSQGEFNESWSNPPLGMISLATNAQGKLFGLGACNSGTDQKRCLYSFDEKGQYQKNTIEVPDLLKNTFTISPSGNFYLVDNEFENDEVYGMTDNDVIEIDKEGKLVHRYPRVGQGIQDLVVDSQGVVTTLNTGSTNAGKVSLSKIIKGTIQKDWLFLERAGLKIATDASGNIYTAYGKGDSASGLENEIVKISPEKKISKAKLGNQIEGDTYTIAADDSNAYVLFTDHVHDKSSSTPGSYIMKFDSGLKPAGTVWSSPNGRFATVFHLLPNKDDYIVFAGLDLTNVFGDHSNYYFTQCK